MMLRNDEGYQDHLYTAKNEESSAGGGAVRKFSVVSSTGSRSKSPRVIGWKGEVVDAFRPIDIEIKDGRGVPSPLNSASSFQSGKMFWTSFLEQKDVPALSSSSVSENSDSQFAEIIQQSMSTVSSITEGSGLRSLKISTLAVNTGSQESLSISSIDKAMQKSHKHKQRIGKSPSTSDIERTGQKLSCNNKGMWTKGNGKNRASPVAYPFGTLPMKSPRFKTMSETFHSPKSSRDGENSEKDVLTLRNSKSDVSSLGSPMVEQNLAPSWTTLRRGKIQDKGSSIPHLKMPPPSSNASENFKLAYSVWQRVGLMKDNRDETTSYRAVRGTESRQNTVGNQYEKKNGTAEALKGNDVVGFHKTRQRAGLMKKNTGLTSNVPKRQSGTRCVESKTAVGYASGGAGMAPDANGNPYRVWQKVGLMKSRRNDVDEDADIWPSSLMVPSPTAEVHEPKVIQRTSEDANEDKDEDLKNIFQQWQYQTDTAKNNLLDAEGFPLRTGGKENSDGGSMSLNGRSNGRLSIQTASSPNENTIDFFDQMRERISPRGSASSALSRMKQQSFNCFGKDPDYPKSPVQPSSAFQAFENRASESQGFDATIRAGRENLHPWEDISREDSSLPVRNHFREISKSIECSDPLGDKLSNLGGNRAIILMERNGKYEVLAGHAKSPSNEQELVLKNLELISSEQKMEKDTECDGGCQCSHSLFSGNDDLINFFLPQMGMACTCGQQQWGFANPDDPTAIENVLRPWQVRFLHRFGIKHAEQLVKARHRSASILAKAMRQWRMKEGLQAFRTSSCAMALDIWSKTCKAYVRSARKQMQHECTSRKMPPTLIPEITKYLMENPQERTPGKSFEMHLA